jgi:hypothetical protein
MSHQAANISAGTQIVSLVEVRGPNRSLVHPRGAVGVVTRKPAGPEQARLEDAAVAFHESEYQRLRAVLRLAHEASRLPELPADKARGALNELLVRVRLAQRHG